MHSWEKQPCVFPGLLCYPGSVAIPLWVSLLPLYKEGVAGDDSEAVRFSEALSGGINREKAWSLGSLIRAKKAPSPELPNQNSLLLQGLVSERPTAPPAPLTHINT